MSFEVCVPLNNAKEASNVQARRNSRPVDLRLRRSLCADSASHESPRAGDAGVVSQPTGADANKLIGRSIKNAQDETIGKVEFVYIDKDGKVDSVIVGVGGFLGMGEREVKLAWKDLKISQGGEKVTVNMTKDQLKAMAPYKYSDTKWRGHAFNDTGIYSPGANPTAAATPADRNGAPHQTASNSTVSTGDFNANGQIAGSALIGAKVHNTNNDTIGSVEDIYIDNNGAIQTVVVSVGGFLGMGTKDVAVKWSDIKYGHDGKSLMLTTNWTKDSLKAMPDYKYERRQPVTKTGG